MMISRLAALMDTWGASARRRQAETGWPSESRDDIRFFRTAKTQYRYRERGAGPVIIFTADPPVTLEQYDDLLARYSTRFRVIVVELPAMGFSIANNRFGFGFRESADDIADFVAGVAGQTCILAFSCASGLAAVDIAVRRPELCAKLVLIQTTDWAGFDAWRDRRDPKKILSKPFIGQVVMRRLAPSRLPMWFDLAVGREEDKPKFCDCASASLDKGAQWSLASAYQRYFRYGEARGRKATQPTLCLWGAADGSHPTEAAKAASNLSEDARLKVFDDLGHFADLEDVERVYREIESFVFEQQGR